MDIFLQAWGGVFYLLSKLFICYAEGYSEGTTKERRWRMYGWVAGLIGSPAWLIILTAQHLWIVTAVEAGGLPSMILGIAAALKGSKRAPQLLNKIAEVFTHGLLGIAIIYSLYACDGVPTISQVLELGVTAGYLIGTYKLARKHPSGWLLYVFMNGCMGTILATQGKWFLVAQQAVSLIVDVYGYIRARRRLTSS